MIGMDRERENQGNPCWQHNSMMMMMMMNIEGTVTGSTNVSQSTWE